MQLAPKPNSVPPPLSSSSVRSTGGKAGSVFALFLAPLLTNNLHGHPLGAYISPRLNPNSDQRSDQPGS